MWRCHYCQGALSVPVVQKLRLCPHCGSDLQCCLNCVHYDETVSARCREAESPWIADRAAQNDCPYFEMSPETRPTPAGPLKEGSDAERAKQAFRALFRSP